MNTSKEAYYKPETQHQVNTIRAQIEGFMLGNCETGYSARQVQEKTNAGTLNSVKSRLSEMVKDGTLFIIPDKTRTEGGHKVQLYQWRGETERSSKVGYKQAIDKTLNELTTEFPAAQLMSPEFIASWFSHRVQQIRNGK